ncbi:MAG: hypothetical protein HY713_10785 [candidate division NC10 bacterium]|nr:hypothetical protein [candidate division NC10 bacterium]
MATHVESCLAAAALALLLVVPASLEAQVDFAGAVAVKIRTFPLKRAQGRPVLGRDGMPEPAAAVGGRPADVRELPTFPVDENFPGASILSALLHYQRRDPLGALAPVVAVLSNGYLELEIEKACHVDTVRIQVEHKPTPEVPAFTERGLGALMHVVTDAVMAADLQRAHTRLRDRYNSGLSTDRKGDQDAMTFFQALRLVIAQRYDPRVTSPALSGLPPAEAKNQFKAALAQGGPVEGDVLIGPLHLAMRAKQDRRDRRPAPPGC